MSTPSAWAPAGVRLPPQTLRLTAAGRMACSPQPQEALAVGGPPGRFSARIIEVILPGQTKLVAACASEPGPGALGLAFAQQGTDPAKMAFSQ
jgi:hypothetical protein